MIALTSLMVCGWESFSEGTQRHACRAHRGIEHRQLAGYSSILGSSILRRHKDGCREELSFASGTKSSSLSFAEEALRRTDEKGCNYALGRVRSGVATLHSIQVP